jgi:hypothetical protein
MATDNDIRTKLDALVEAAKTLVAELESRRKGLDGRLASIEARERALELAKTLAQLPESERMHKLIEAEGRVGMLEEQHRARKARLDEIVAGS